MAFDAVEEVLDLFPWLADLGPEVYDILVSGVTNADPYAVIIQNVRNTNAYKSRFAGLLQRQAAGLPAINEAEYLELENGYLTQLREFQILGTLGLNDTDAFRAFAADLIGSDVSVSEFNFRLDQGVALMRDSADYVQQAFQEFYGITPTDDALLVWALDPDRGLDIIEDQIAAARIGGEAFKFGLNISRTRAEILRQEGVSADLAKAGFANIAQEMPVLNRLASIHSINPLSQTELEEFFFHEDPDIAARRANTFSTALAAFQEGGARNLTNQGGIGELVDRNRVV
jgi:hypothetical protein